jgi:hypothetical protein
MSSSSDGLLRLYVYCTYLYGSKGAYPFPEDYDIVLWWTIDALYVLGAPLCIQRGAFPVLDEFILVLWWTFDALHLLYVLVPVCFKRSFSFPWGLWPRPLIDFGGSMCTMHTFLYQKRSLSYP